MKDFFLMVYDGFGLGTAAAIITRLVGLAIICLILYFGLSFASYGLGAISNYFTDSAIAAKKKELDDLETQRKAKLEVIAGLDLDEAAKRQEIADLSKQRDTALADKLAADKARDESVAATNKLIADLAGFKGKKNVTAADVDCVVLGRCK